MLRLGFGFWVILSSLNYNFVFFCVLYLCLFIYFFIFFILGYWNRPLLLFLLCGHTHKYLGKNNFHFIWNKRKKISVWLSQASKQKGRELKRARNLKQERKKSKLRRSNKGLQKEIALHWKAMFFFFCCYLYFYFLVVSTYFL